MHGLRFSGASTAVKVIAIGLCALPLAAGYADARAVSPAHGAASLPTQPSRPFASRKPPRSPTLRRQRLPRPGSSRRRASLLPQAGLRTVGSLPATGRLSMAKPRPPASLRLRVNPPAASPRRRSSQRAAHTRLREIHPVAVAATHTRDGSHMDRAPSHLNRNLRQWLLDGGRVGRQDLNRGVQLECARPQTALNRPATANACQSLFRLVERLSRSAQAAPAPPVLRAPRALPAPRVAPAPPTRRAHRAPPQGPRVRRRAPPRRAPPAQRPPRPLRALPLQSPSRLNPPSGSRLPRRSQAPVLSAPRECDARR